MEQLKDNDGNIVKGSEIIKFVNQFYEQLYSSQQPTSNDIQSYLNNTALPKLNINEAEICGAFLQEEECLRALKQMHNNKSPGSDGLTKEFYLKCWDFIGEDLVEVLNNCHLNGEMGETMKEGHITLLFKKKRPIPTKELATSQSTQH